MEIRFLENGLDSLQKGYNALQKYEEAFYFDTSLMTKTERFYLLKDAVLSTQHGIEILFKYVLSKSNELLIFSNLDNQFKQAYEQKRKSGLKSIFQLADNFKLHTISFSETIDRIDKLTTIEISNKFKDKLLKIESYRNQIMHSEIFTFESQLHSIFEGVIEELDMLLHKYLGEEYKTISGYSELVSKYKKASETISDHISKIKAEIVEEFIRIFGDIGIGIGEKEVIRIIDINKATQIIDALFKTEFEFGADLNNGYCTGKIKSLKRIDDSRFSIYAEDNDGEYIFKFKSLIIYFPPIEEEKSPLIFFENDNDEIEEELRKYITTEEDYQSIEGVIFKDGSGSTYKKEEVEEIYYKHETYQNCKEFYSSEKFLTKGIFCFINIQQINYDDLGRMLWKFGKLDGKKFEIILRKFYTEES